MSAADGFPDSDPYISFDEQVASLRRLGEHYDGVDAEEFTEAADAIERLSKTLTLTRNDREAWRRDAETSQGQMEALRESDEYLRTLKHKFESITADWPDAGTVNVWIAELEGLRRRNAAALSSEDATRPTGDKE